MLVARRHRCRRDRRVEEAVAWRRRGAEEARVTLSLYRTVGRVIGRPYQQLRKNDLILVLTD
jgi:hypothetical protein